MSKKKIFTPPSTPKNIYFTSIIIILVATRGYQMVTNWSLFTKWFECVIKLEVCCNVCRGRQRWEEIRRTHMQTQRCWWMFNKKQAFILGCKKAKGNGRKTNKNLNSKKLETSTNKRRTWDKSLNMKHKN